MRVRPFRNFGAKVAALVLAAAVWLHVATERRYEAQLIAPIEVSGLSESQAIDGVIPDSARVSVRADGKTLVRVGERGGLRLRLDLSGSRLGDTTVVLTPEMVAAPFGEEMEIVEVASPRSVAFNVARRAAREVPVVPRVTVNLAFGFVQTGPPVVKPGRVSVSGPYRTVAMVHSVPTSEVVIANASATDRRSVWIPPPAPGVVVDPEYVMLSVPVEKSAEREFEVPVKLRGAPRGARVDPPVVLITLAGGRAMLDSLDASDLNVYIEYARAVQEGGETSPYIETPAFAYSVRIRPQVFRVVGP